MHTILYISPSTLYAKIVRILSDKKCINAFTEKQYKNLGSCVCSSCKKSISICELILLSFTAFCPKNTFQKYSSELIKFWALVSILLQTNINFYHTKRSVSKAHFQPVSSGIRDFFYQAKSLEGLICIIT